MAATKKRFDAVLFDMDGVLIDSYGVWFELMNAAAAKWGYAAISREAFAGYWGQGIEEDQAKVYPRQTIAELEAYFDAHFMDHVEHLTVDPSVGAVFDGLRARGVPSAVVTNTPNPLAARLVEHAGGTPDTVVGGTDIARAKPAPDIVHEACARLGVEAKGVLVVGDSRFDAEAAAAAGASFAGIGGIEGAITLGGLAELLDYV